MSDEYAKAFPQASKLDATKKAGPLLYQFLDWLQHEKEYVFARWESSEVFDNEEYLVRVFVDPRTLVLEFLDIDPVAYEAELEKMLAQLRGKKEG